MTDQKKQDWGKFIATGIVASVIGVMIGSYGNIGINTVKLEYIDVELEKKVDNNVLIEYIKYNNRTLDYIIELVGENKKDTEQLRKDFEKLKDEKHAFELKYIGEEISRSPKKKSEVTSDGTLTTGMSFTQNTITKFGPNVNQQNK